MTFDQWYNQLDLEIQFRTGVPISDLPVKVNTNWYGQCLTVEQAATKLLELLKQ